MSVLNLINGYMPLKPSLIGDPDIYLGAKLKMTQLENGIWAWGLSPSKYVAQAVKNCEKHLTAVFSYPSMLTTGSLMTIVLAWTCLIPSTQNAPHSIKSLLV
jgi:hypothetical protein